MDDIANLDVFCVTKGLTRLEVFASAYTLIGLHDLESIGRLYVCSLLMGSLPKVVLDYMNTRRTGTWVSPDLPTVRGVGHA